MSKSRNGLRWMVKSPVLAVSYAPDPTTVSPVYDTPRKALTEHRRWLRWMREADGMGNGF